MEGVVYFTPISKQVKYHFLLRSCQNSTFFEKGSIHSTLNCYFLCTTFAIERKFATTEVLTIFFWQKRQRVNNLSRNTLYKKKTISQLIECHTYPLLNHNCKFAEGCTAHAIF